MFNVTEAFSKIKAYSRVFLYIFNISNYRNDNLVTWDDDEEENVYVNQNQNP